MAVDGLLCSLPAPVASMTLLVPVATRHRPLYFFRYGDHIHSVALLMKRSFSGPQYPAQSACENRVNLRHGRKRNRFRGLGSDIKANGAVHPAEIAFVQPDAFLPRFMEQPLSPPLGPKQTEVS